MNRRSLRRILFLLLLTSTLVRPWAGAAELRPTSSDIQKAVSLAPLDLFDEIWGFVSSLWSKEGCILDPDGLHATGGSGTGDEGCILDPNGLCAAATPAQGEAGCILDPDGRCVR